MNSYYLIVLTAYLTLPGLALSSILKIRATILNSVALSYTIFVGVYIIATQNNMTAQGLSALALTVMIISAIACGYLLWRQLTHLRSKPIYYYIFGIVFSVLLYNYLFGVFAEIPADIYAHLERFQAIKASISENNTLLSTSWEKLLLTQSRVWYYLMAITSLQTATPTVDVITSTSAITNSIFIVVTFSFATSVFRKTPKYKLVSLITCCFVVLHMGINVFSFIRYYALAPTTIGFCLYFAAISLFLKSIGSPISRQGIKRFIIIFFIAIAAAINHTQEALFIAVIATLITVIHSVRLHINAKFSDTAETTNLRLWTAFSILAIASFITIYAYTRLNLTRMPNAHWRLWEFGPGWGIIPKITILNLKFQFAQVITLWGGFVYILFFLHWSRYRENLFLMAGMLSPAFTILNPFFVDMFLRLDDSTTLWRLCYLIPIHFVAADQLVLHTSRLINGRFSVQVISAAIVLPMIAFLTPVKNTWNGLHYSRTPTLMKSDHELTYTNYRDLISYLDDLDGSYQILTDPMSGYMISAITRHNSYRRKFFTDYSYEHFSFENYDDNPLDSYVGYLLIVNLRPKSESKIGAQSGHWRENEWLETRHYYPSQLLDHLKSRPERFEEIWHVEDVIIYRITEN